MAGNAPNDWFPLPTGNHQVDENQRRIWQSLYYLRDQTKNNNAAPSVSGGMSGTGIFPVTFQMGNNQFGSMVFKDGRLVAVTPLTSNNTAGSLSVNGANNNGGTSLGPSGVPPSTPLPPSTPTVSSLPGSSDPLSTIGQYVIFQGQPYIYTSFPGGPNYWALDVTGAPSIRDTQANLSLYPAANYRLGTVFYATDWLISYAIQFVGGTATWVYYNGIYQNTLANIPAGLGPREYRLLFRASDYLHNWFWTGSAWSLSAAAQSGFAGGLLPGSMVFANPGPPFGGTGALWQLCDGSTVPVSQEDASLVNTTVPTIANTWFVR